MTRFLGIVAVTVAMVLSAATGWLAAQNSFGTPKTIIHISIIQWKEGVSAAEKKQVLDGVKDAEGNLVPRTVWEFQTADEVKPRVVKFLPKAKGVKPGANLRMWINEQVDVVDLENTVVLRELGGAKVAISLTYSPTQRKLVIDPKGRLDRRTTYVVVLKAKFRDAAGNRMDRKVWKFRTR